MSASRCASRPGPTTSGRACASIWRPALECPTTPDPRGPRPIGSSPPDRGRRRLQRLPPSAKHRPANQEPAREQGNEMNTQATTARDYSTAYTVEQTPQEVFAAILDVTAWWTGDVEGPTDHVGA